MKAVTTVALLPESRSVCTHSRSTPVEGTRTIRLGAVDAASVEIGEIVRLLSVNGIEVEAVVEKKEGFSVTLGYDYTCAPMGTGYQKKTAPWGKKQRFNKRW